MQISRNNEEVGQQHSEQLTAAFLTEQLGNLRLRVTFRRVIGEHTVLDLPACASSDVLVQGQQHAAMHCNTLQHTATHCNTQGDDRHSLQPVPRTVGALHHVQGSVGISVLQCVTVCCSVLQCVAACCSVLQCVAVCYSVLQCAAVRCSVLQCAAVCCSVLRCAALCCSVLQRAAVCCSVLQCAVLRCSVLQCVSVCCIVLCCIMFKALLVFPFSNLFIFPGLLSQNHI